MGVVNLKTVDADRLEAKRQCGECQACCEVLGVIEIGKPQWTKCEHQCSSGCNLYGNHPDECKQFACLWRAGVLVGDERRRPDKSGLIVTMSEESIRGKHFLTIEEVWPGAYTASPDNQFWLQRIQNETGIAQIVKPYRSSKRIVLANKQFTDDFRTELQEYSLGRSLRNVGEINS